MDLETAETLYEDKKYSQALEIYERLIDDNNIELRAEALVGKANCLSMLGSDKEAVNSYSDALKLIESLDDISWEAEINFLLGVSYFQLYNNYTSLKFIQKAIELDPELFSNRILVNTTLGRNYTSIGDFERAAYHFQKEIEVIKVQKGDTLEVSVLLANAFIDTEDFDKALDLLLKARSEFVSRNNKADLADVLNNLATAYVGLGKEKQAMKHYKEALDLAKEINDSELEQRILGNLGLRYYYKSKYIKALQYFRPVKEFFAADELSGDYLRSLSNIAGCYVGLNKKNKAKELYIEAIHLAQRLTDHTEMGVPLNGFIELDPELALLEALNHPFGQNFILEIIDHRLNNDLSVEGIFWRFANRASVQWWMSLIQGVSDSYQNSWRLAQRITNVSKSTTDETLLNFLMGSNDLRISNKMDEQRDLAPLWFVELPLFVKHDEKHLKIRLNNAIFSNDRYKGYPMFKDGKIVRHKVKRCIITLESQWLQKFERDHIFSPNTKEEMEKFEHDPENTWLSDIYVWDLGNHVKREELLELQFKIELYFRDDIAKPDVQTTNKRMIIPIYRENQYQNLEKKRLQYTNFLTVLIAVSSVIMSILSTFYSFFGTVLRNVSAESLLLGLMILLIIFSVVLLLSLGILFRKINSQNISDTVDPS